MPSFTIPEKAGSRRRSAGVALDGLLVAQAGLPGILPELPLGAALAQQVPPLIQLDLDPPKLLLLGLARRALGLPLEQLVLPAGQLVDAVGDLLVIHGNSPCLG